MTKITGLLIDVENGKVSTQTISKDLYSYYEILHCDVIDIVARKIGEKVYLIVCDDEGLLKNKPKISAINKLGQPMLVGSLFIVNNNQEDDDLSSLTSDDITYIQRYIRMQKTFSTPEYHPILHKVEYF